MSNILKYDDYDKDIETETVSSDCTYLLTIDDIEKLVNNFAIKEISKEDILKDLEKFEFIKLENTNLSKIDDIKTLENSINNKTIDTEIDNIFKPLKKFGEI